MKNGTIIKIGEYQTKVSQGLSGWYLHIINISNKTNNEIYKQFDITFEELKKCVNVSLKEASEGFPYHQTLEDLEKVVQYLQSLENKKNVTNISNTKLEGRSVKFLKNYKSKSNNSYAYTGEIYKIISSTERAIILKDFGALNRARFQEGIIELCPIDQPFDFWDPKYPNPKELIGRKVKFIKDGCHNVSVGTIDEIINNNIFSSSIDLKNYGCCSRARFQEKEVELLPIDYKEIVPTKSLEGRYIKWIKQLAGREIGTISKILTDKPNHFYYELVDGGQFNKTRLTDGTWELLPEDYTIEIIKHDFKKGDKIFGKSSAEYDITVDYNPHGIKNVYTVLEKIVHLSDNDYQIWCGEGYWNCNIQDIYHYQDPKDSSFYLGTSGKLSIGTTQSLSFSTNTNPSIIVFPTSDLQLQSTRLQMGMDPITPGYSYPSRKKPSLLEPPKIKKRVLI